MTTLDDLAFPNNAAVRRRSSSSLLQVDGDVHDLSNLCSKIRIDEQETPADIATLYPEPGFVEDVLSVNSEELDSFTRTLYGPQRSSSIASAPGGIQRRASSYTPSTSTDEDDVKPIPLNRRKSTSAVTGFRQELPQFMQSFEACQQPSLDCIRTDEAYPMTEVDEVGTPFTSTAATSGQHPAERPRLSPRPTPQRMLSRGNSRRSARGRDSLFVSSRSLFGEEEWDSGQAQSFNVEIVPGMDLPLRGSDETRQALRRGGNIAKVHCMDCSETLRCLGDAAFVICPLCRSLSPVGSQQFGESKAGVYGVGLGFLDRLADDYAYDDEHDEG